jgi:hypothetical protein
LGGVDALVPYLIHQLVEEVDAIVLEACLVHPLADEIDVGALGNQIVQVEDASCRVPLLDDVDVDDAAGAEEQEAVVKVVEQATYCDVSYRDVAQNSLTWKIHRDIPADVVESPILTDVAHSHVQRNVDDGKDPVGQTLSPLGDDVLLDGMEFVGKSGQVLMDSAG